MNDHLNLHVVFAKEYLDDLCYELIEEGFQVKQTDTSLDTFSEWARSDGRNHADCAIIYGFELASKGDEYSLRSASYQRLREVRLSREELRLIVIYPREAMADKKFISSIAQLGIYDLHFTDELNIKMIHRWIKDRKGLSHVDSLLGDYQPDDEEEDYQEVVFPEPEEVVEEEASKRRRRSRTKITVEKKEREKVIEKPFISSLRQLTQAPQERVQLEYRSFASKVIVIASTKGGVGKTDIALNLAASIKTHTQINRIAVVDYSFPYGGIAAALKLSSDRSIREWVLKEDETVTEEGLKEKVVSHEGIDFILMSLKIGDSIKFNEHHAETMIDTLRRYYDVVIIDTSGFSQLNLIAYERATEIILVTSHDVLSLSNGLAFKEDLIYTYGINHEKISVFLNQVPKIEDIKADAIAQEFEDDEVGVPVIGYAPYDDSIRQFRNKGLFIYKEKANHSFSLGIDMILKSLQLVPDSMINSQKKEERKGSLFKIFERA